MAIKEKYLAIVALLVVTVLTALTSLEHHRVIAEHYGLVAVLFDPLIAISAFILGAFISLFFQWGINVIHFEQVVKLLPTNERTVLKILFNKGTITQADLASEAGLSRLMISRIVSNLEKKDVIIKKSLDNTNLIKSKLYRVHPTTQVLTRLPGLSEKRMIITISLVFLFGIFLSVLNSLHIFVLGHPLRPAMYLLAIEFFALGGLTNLLLRGRISHVQFERILAILPKDERDILRVIYLNKSITQKDLMDKTGIYKMKISRMLRKFEQRGLIGKKPYGYTNLIISKI